jgi:hypothetical protein
MTDEQLDLRTVEMESIKVSYGKHLFSLDRYTLIDGLRLTNEDISDAKLLNLVLASSDAHNLLEDAEVVAIVRERVAKGETDTLLHEAQLRSIMADASLMQQEEQLELVSAEEP